MASERVTMILRQGLLLPEAGQKPALFVVDCADAGALGSVHGFGDARYTVAGFLDINTETRAIEHFEPDSSLAEPWELATPGAIFPLDGDDKLTSYSTLYSFMIDLHATSRDDLEAAAHAKRQYNADVERGGAFIVKRPIDELDTVTSRWLLQVYELTG
jgi:hypothetical protein